MSKSKKSEKTQVRLDRFLADAGAGTRSEVKKMIQKGRVLVNDQPASGPEQKISPDLDRVLLDGKEQTEAPDFLYYILNKPAGYISATEDSKDKTVMDLLPKIARRNLFPVGRLDKDTEGLLLITDDGALAHELLSPAKHVDKTYYAKVKGVVTKEEQEVVKNGVDIGEAKLTMPAKLEILNTDGEYSEILLTIREGKFHQVKRMMEAVGKTVVYLKRLSMGGLVLPEDLPIGQWRMLTTEERKIIKRL
ncbi:MAG: pseudouridine synthase [Blautia sp.]